MARVKCAKLTAEATSIVFPQQQSFCARTILGAHGIPAAALARPALPIVDLVMFVKMVYCSLLHGRRFVISKVHVVWNIGECVPANEGNVCSGECGVCLNGDCVNDQT